MKPSAEQVTGAIHGPYEDLAIEALKLAEKIIDGQPKDVQEQIWRVLLADWREWRAFFKGEKAQERRHAVQMARMAKAG